MSFERSAVRVILVFGMIVALAVMTTALRSEGGLSPNAWSAAGRLEYADSSGHAYAQNFVASAEHERKSLRHDEEELRTHIELQKLPEVLKVIGRELELIRRREPPPDL